MEYTNYLFLRFCHGIEISLPSSVGLLFLVITVGIYQRRHFMHSKYMHTVGQPFGARRKEVGTKSCPLKDLRG